MAGWQTLLIVLLVLSVWLSPPVPTPTSSRLPAKDINAAENLGQRTAVTIGYLLLVEPKGADARS